MYFCPTLLNPHTAAVALKDMVPKRKSEGRKPEVPAFGRLLKSLRERRFHGKLTPERVATRLREEFSVITTGGSIRGYEKGWNKAIDPLVFFAMADLYRVQPQILAHVLKANRNNPGLTDFEVEKIIKTKGRGYDANAVASSRFAEIGKRLAAISAELQEYAFESEEYAPPVANSPRGQAPKTGNGPSSRDPDHRDLG